MPMSALNTGGGMKRMLGGMPHILSIAHGPGRIAFSRDAAGEVVVLPLHPSMELDVREHAFLAGTHSLDYSFVRIKGLANMLHGGGGMYMDRFVTQHEPGLLLLHGYGNVFQKTLQPGEKIMVEPGGFLYKDSSVTMNAVQQNVKTGLMQPRHVPGRDDRPRPGRHPVHVRPPRLRVGTPCRCHPRGAYTCPYCRMASDGGGGTCPHCGAPIDVRLRVSDSGWVEQPPIRDMARIRFSRSTCQISGTYVPVAEMGLHDDDWVYFSHHALLHADPQVRLDTMQMKGGWNRMLAGMPLIMMTAQGPGHIAFSADQPGETLAVPLHARPGRRRGRAPLPARHRERHLPAGRTPACGSPPGTATTQERHYPLGQTIDRFVGPGRPRPAAAARPRQHVHPRPGTAASGSWSSRAG